MSKVTKRKAQPEDAPERKRKKSQAVEEVEQPVITTVDKTEGSKPGKDTKRKTSTSEVDSIASTQESNAKVIQLPQTMTLKTSDLLSAKGEKNTLKLASWNINGIRAWLTNGGLKYIEQEQPDMIGFQELKCDKEKIPLDATPTGYKSYWLSGDTAGYSGVGLLTKIDPIDVKFGIGVTEHDLEGRVITAEYDRFYFVVSYIPNSGRKLVRLNYRQQFNQALRNYLKELDQKKPVIWCGDLNVSHQSIDLANPKTNSKTAGFSKEERDDFGQILAEGFIDSFRHLYPAERDAYTFWSYFRNARQQNVGWRLDYFILSARLQEHLCDVIHQTDVYGSDHCPIVLLLSI